MINVQKSVMRDFLVMAAFITLLLSATMPLRAIEKGGDISELTIEQQNGVVFQDANGNALSEPLSLCKTYGWTVARIRLFVNPPNTGVQVNDLTYAVNEAKRAKAQGMKILLDMHYSDNWNDPGYHDIPAAWKGQTYSQLLATVKNYTVNVMNTLKSNGVVPEYVQIGNEIGNGFLFPIGGSFTLNSSGQPSDSTLYSQFIGLVKAGIAGVKSVSSTSKIMIHIPGGQWPTWVTQYFDLFNKQGVSYDIIGLSYYPDTTKSGVTTTDLSDIKSTLNALHNRYSGKKFWITEFSYMWNWGTTSGTGYYWNDTTGQRLIVSDLCNLVASYSDGGGVCYWGCFYVANDALGTNNWASKALFDTTWYSNDGGTTWVINPYHKMLSAFGSL